MDKPDQKWKRFEKAVYEIQKQLAPDSVVKLNDFILGTDSKVQRQVDVSIRRNIAQYSILIVIDCKDYKEPVDVKTVEEFAGLLKDVRAHKGALISSKGFTPAGINYAKAHGIDTFRLVDTESMDWKAYASVPVILESTSFKGFRIIFKNFSSLPIAITTSDIQTLNLFTKDGVLLGPIGKLVGEKWNMRKMDGGLKQQEILLGKEVILEVGGEKVLPIDVYAVVHMEKNYYLGNLPVHLKGLQDLQGGGVMTREITTDIINPSEIEKGLVSGWEKIENPEKLSTKPFMQIVFQDYIPIEEMYPDRELGS